jgi:hypothetical protein
MQNILDQVAKVFTPDRTRMQSRPLETTTPHALGQGAIQIPERVL